MALPSQKPFDYSKFTIHESDLRDTARKIRGKIKVSVRLIVSAASELQRIKQLLGHGMFSDWIAAELPDYSERTIQRWMQLAVLDDKTDTVSVLSLSTLYKLTAKSTSVEMRERILDDLKTGSLPRTDAAVVMEMKRMSQSRNAVHGATVSEDRDLDDNEKWERTLTTLVAALARGLGDRAEEYLDAVLRLDGREFQYHFDRHLREARGRRR